MEIIKPASQEEWLALRAKDITSTEAPALFGLSPYCTEFELWHRKREATVVAIEENERMKWGKRLQDAIAAGIAQDNIWAIRRMDEYVRVPELRLGSSFDFRVQAHPHLLLEDGKAPVPFPHEAGKETESDCDDDELLEIKNVDALIFKDKWIVDEDGNVEAPPHIEVQVQHQLLVSNLKRARIGALIGGNKVMLITRDRDDRIVSAIKAKAAAFWKSIDDGIAPAPDFRRDAEFIGQLYGYAEPGRVIDASESADVAALVASYRAAQQAEKKAGEDKEAAKAALLMQIGDAEKVLGPGWSISAGMIGPANIEYERKPYRNFRVNVSKKKEAVNA